MENPYLSIIIPAHNEALRLPAALERVAAFVRAQSYPCEVLVVENGSKDETAAIARAWLEKLPELRVLSLQEAGKGSAVKAGMLAARGACRYMADTDFSVPLEELPRILEAMQAGADVAIGSREAPGALRIGEPFYRHWSGRFFNMLVRWWVVPGIQDTQCGFKCFSAGAAEALFPLQTMSGWSFDVEVLAAAQQNGYRVQEVPVTWTYGTGSRIKPLRDAYALVSELWKIRANSRRGAYRARPL
ncbi:MAG: dolichyl-phosphate beta-glucosyltransferase [Anaerolineaceae bacterium]